MKAKSKKPAAPAGTTITNCIFNSGPQADAVAALVAVANAVRANAEALSAAAKGLEGAAGLVINGQL